MAFDLRLHSDSAIVPAGPDRALIVDLACRRTDLAWLAHFCFPRFRARAKPNVDSVAVDLCFCPLMATAMEFRLPEIADSFAVRFSPAPGSICPENLCLGYFRIGFAIAPADSVVAAAGFDLCRNCSATEIVVGPGFARRRFVADSCLSYFVVAAVVLALVFVSGAVSTARSFF